MSTSLIAVDVGNSFLHVAHYSYDVSNSPSLPYHSPWPGSARTEVLRSSQAEFKWLESLPSTSAQWVVVSVNRQREFQLASAIRETRPSDRYHRLTDVDFPLQIDVDVPGRVGTDRLAASLAAFRLRRQSGPAIVIDAGTALTVDRVDEPGIFRGGTIFPGSYLLAESLHRHTDALPLVVPNATAPPPLGKNTEDAIRAGLFWGTVGAMRELVHQLSTDLDAAPEVFLTGGEQQKTIADLLNATYVPDLVLLGVALAGFHWLQAHAG